MKIKEIRTRVIEWRGKTCFDKRAIADLTAIMA